MVLIEVMAKNSTEHSSYFFFPVILRNYRRKKLNKYCDFQEHNTMWNCGSIIINIVVLMGVGVKTSFFFSEILINCRGIFAMQNTIEFIVF